MSPAKRSQGSKASTTRSKRKAARPRPAKRTAAKEKMKKKMKKKMPAKASARPSGKARAARPRPAAAPLPQVYIGQIALFGFDFAPEGWIPCNGELLPISQNINLFTLIGTTYGGNGIDDFAVPSLPPRGPGGPDYYIALEGAFPIQG
jgi:hypothetical protein